jgi:hypothetical protein
MDRERRGRTVTRDGDRGRECKITKDRVCRAVKYGGKLKKTDLRNAN